MVSRDIVVPSPGDHSDKIQLTRWHVPDGSHVRRGRLIATLETTKVFSELEAESEGVLQHVVELGKDVRVGEAIGRIVPRPTDSSLAEKQAIVLSFCEAELAQIDRLSGQKSREDDLTTLIRDHLVKSPDS